MNKLIETLAAQVYAKMPYDGTGEKPAWVPCGNSNKQDEARRTVRSVLSAIEAAGMVVVPKEPTEAMARAGSLTLRDTFRAEFNHAKAIYRAMIAAEDA